MGVIRILCNVVALRALYAYLVKHQTGNPQNHPSPLCSKATQQEKQVFTFAAFILSTYILEADINARPSIASMCVSRQKKQLGYCAHCKVVHVGKDPNPRFGSFSTTYLIFWIGMSYRKGGWLWPSADAVDTH